MYSPRIDEGLIPVLYRLGKARKLPMTTLVNEMIFAALERMPLPEEAQFQFNAVVPRYRQPEPAPSQAAA